MPAESPPPGKDSPEGKAFIIEIDGAQYEWPDEKITGAQLRQLPPTPIPADHALYQGMDGHPDVQIKDDDTIEVHDGLRFFTVPVDASADTPGHKPFTIRIDRTQYELPDEKISGAQLRSLPSPPIPPNRDIFQVIPGHPDLQIKDDDTIEVHDGLRFFTAPNTINPGANPSSLKAPEPLQ